MMHESKKSDLAVVAVKPTDRRRISAAKAVEPRAGAEGNVGQQSTHRTQIRARVSQALKRTRTSSSKGKEEERLTALLHHIDLDLLRLSFFARLVFDDDRLAHRLTHRRAGSDGVVEEMTTIRPRRLGLMPGIARARAHRRRAPPQMPD